MILAMNPSEVSIGGVYFPPSLVVGILGLVVSWGIVTILNRKRLARYFWNPPLAFVAIWVLASAIIGLLILSP